MTDATVHSLTQKSVLDDTDEVYLVQSPYGSGDDRKSQWGNVKSTLTAQGLAGLPLSGPLTFLSDNTYDIGAVAATRPRTGYFGTNVVAGASVQAGTTLQAGTNVQISASGLGFWVGRSQISSPVDGNLLLWDSAQATFGRLQFGGISASFPALKRSGAGLQARLADDTGYTDFTAGLLSSIASISAGTSISAGAYVTTSGGGFICADGQFIGANSFGGFNFVADGVFTLRNGANNDFGRLQFGGTTSSFPALKRSTTEVQVRLADDSDWATLALGTASSALKVGTFSASADVPVTGFITIKDSAGNDRKIAVIA